MPRIFLACEADVRDHPFARRDYERLLCYSSLDEIQKHLLTKDPSEADIVAFIGSSRPNFSDIRSSLLFDKHKDKSVIYFSGDRAVPILPGVYTCLENKVYNRHRKSLLAGYYLRITDNDSLDTQKNINDAKYLFSFMGNVRNHPVRETIFELEHGRAYLRDSSSDIIQQDDGINGKNRDRGMMYREVLSDSKFVLCPRGIGVSSWRLFETMRAGRVPVIISDEWVRPLGPEWSKFSIFVDEKHVVKIPRLLEEREHQAPFMGAKARAEWERWYSNGRVFTTVVDHLLAAHSAYVSENNFSKLSGYLQYLEPYFVRHWILSPMKRRIQKLVAH